MDTVQGPFTYEAREPKKIQFVPLNQTALMTGEELMTFYEVYILHLKVSVSYPNAPRNIYQADRKLSKFLPIIRDAPRYPVIYDAKGRVLSLPPIINSDHSKIKLTTKNVLIECTATDLTKARIVLNTIVCMFSKYCKVPFTYVAFHAFSS